MESINRFEPGYRHEGHTIADILDQLKAVLPVSMFEFLDQLRNITLIEIRDYQSRQFRRAGYSQYPESYGSSDGFLAELVNRDGAEFLIMVNKAQTGPYQLGSAVTHGIDLRPIIVHAIKVGTDNIEVLTSDNQIEVYRGHLGKLEVLLPNLVNVLGREVALERVP